MTTSALVLESHHPLLDALDRELDGEPEADVAGHAFHEVPWRVRYRALGAPLRDFLQRPGKEFRGELAKLFYRLGGRKDGPPANLPLALEALHAGSLIVDDVEDESMERRGRPALHLLHGVPIALNAGNWLYFWGSELLHEIEMTPETRARSSRLMTRALLDCHYGQALDLSVRASELARSEVAGVVRATTNLKTGSLVGLATGLGALLGGAREEVVRASFRFGRDLGAALQMLDDASGVLSPRRFHKGHEDLSSDRPSWTWAWLASSLPEPEFETLRARGRAVAEGADPAPLATEMRALLGGLPKRRVHEHLEAALSRLSVHRLHAPFLTALRREIERLEKSYV